MGIEWKFVKEQSTATPTASEVKNWKLELVQARI
jgi:hypothetical protein